MASGLLSPPQRPTQALAIGGALPLPRPGWLSSPTLGRANRFLSTAAVSLMTPRRPLSTSEKVKVRTLSAEQRTREDSRCPAGQGQRDSTGSVYSSPPRAEPGHPPTVSLSCGLTVSQGRGKCTLRAGNRFHRNRPWSCRKLPAPPPPPCSPCRSLRGPGERASSWCEAHPGSAGRGENSNGL